MHVNAKKKVLFIILPVCAFAAVFFSLRYVNSEPYGKRIETTLLRLHGARHGIEKFREIKGRFPSSLSELRNWGYKNPEAYIYPGDFCEFISDEQGNCRENNQLDGEGGLYYNKDTGEVKVNITKQIKYYLKYLPDFDRYETPSEW
jgi:hypothetical protein